MSYVGKSDYSGKQDKNSVKRFKSGNGGDQSAVDQSSAVLKSFQQYSAQLDKKHDRYERIVKLSRDLTIESKRIIFLLHSIDRGREQEKVITEAKIRLDNLVKDCLCKIAKELVAEDPYMFHRAFTFGLQEFIEAYTFYHYLKDRTFNHWNYYQDLLKYNMSGEPENEIVATLPPIDYILGVADFSGELMRKCINNLGTGDLNGCFETCELVKNLYTGFLSISSYKTKELSEKTFTLKQNVLKMEKVCYNINVRSKELPEHMLIHLVTGFEEPNKDY